MESTARCGAGFEENHMLVLSRKVGQSIIIGDGIEITIVEMRGDQVRLGIEAPREVPINRKEIVERARNQAASGRAPAPPAEVSASFQAPPQAKEVIASVAEPLPDTLAPHEPRPARVCH